MSNHKIGALKRSLKIKKDQPFKAGSLIEKMNADKAASKRKVAIMGLI